jgi:hypothetical protein
LWSRGQARLGADSVAPFGGTHRYVVQQIRQPVAAPGLAGERVVAVRHRNALGRMRIKPQRPRGGDAAAQVVPEGDDAYRSERRRAAAKADRATNHRQCAEIDGLSPGIPVGVNGDDGGSRQEARERLSDLAGSPSLRSPSTRASKAWRPGPFTT